jgi:hypothetical protein
VCTLYANYVAFEILYKHVLLFVVEGPKSLVFHMQREFVSPGITITTRVETLALIRVVPYQSPPTLVNLVMGPLGPPWLHARHLLAVHAANMEIVIGYYWLLSSKSLQIKPPLIY